MNRREFLTSGAVVAATVVVARARSSSAQAGGAPMQRASFGAPGRDFPKVGGDLANQNHSTLVRITRANVGRLGGARHVNLEGGNRSMHQQSTIVAQNGVLYVQTTQQNLLAVDGKSGRIRWKAKLGTRPTSMGGVALGEGKVFSTSGDNIVHAFAQESGRSAWQQRLLTPKEEGGNPAVDDEGNPVGGLAGAVVYWDSMIYPDAAFPRRRAVRAPLSQPR